MGVMGASRKDDDHLGLDEQLCFALYAASRAMTRIYGPLLEPLGITYPQYLVMLALWEENGASVKRIGERLMLDSGTLTPLLKRLEAQGLVARRRSTEDERVVHIDLTSAGKALRAKAKQVPARLACRAGFEVETRAGREKLGAMRGELRALIARIDALADGENPPRSSPVVASREAD